MKKIIVLSVLVFAMLFVVTGCGSKSTSQSVDNDGEITVSASKSENEDSVNNLYFQYENGGVMDNTANGKRIKYEGYSIIISFQKEKTIDEIADEKKMTFSSTEKINKLDWQIYKFTGNVISTIYLYEKDNGTYNVTFAMDATADIDLDDTIKQFMNNVYFK